MESRSLPMNDMSGSPLTNGRFSNRAARFYWADEEPQKSFSIQHIEKLSNSHFEESPLVIASISAGVIGVAIIIIILVGIWIRSRLYTEEGRQDNRGSVRSSTSTLDETVCIEMEQAVIGSVTNANCENITIKVESEAEPEPTHEPVDELSKEDH